MSVCLLVGRPSLPVCHNFIRQVKSEQLFILFCMYFWGQLHWWRSDMFFALLYVVFLGVPFQGTFLCMIQRSLYAWIPKVSCHMSYVTGCIFFTSRGIKYLFHVIHVFFEYIWFLRAPLKGTFSCIDSKEVTLANVFVGVALAFELRPLQNKTVVVVLLNSR